MKDAIVHYYEVDNERGLMTKRKLIEARDREVKREVLRELMRLCVPGGSARDWFSETKSMLAELEAAGTGESK